jgi:predicted aspartyl protease
MCAFSRRRFVGTGAASFAVSPFSARAQDALPSQPLGPASRLVAATDRAQHLTVGVLINGKGPFRFVVDTGAERSVIAEEVAAFLSLARGARVMIEGVIRTIGADTVNVAELVVGPATHRNLCLPVLPRSQLMADGYLGLDVIDGYRVTFDFRNSALVLSEPLRIPRHMRLFGWVPPNEVMVPVVGQNGRLHAFDCGVDGLRAVAFVDTGAEISVGNSQLFDALVANDPSYIKPVSIPLTGVTGGTINGRVTTLKHVRMNALSMDNGNVAIANLQIFDLWGLSGRPALLIGMNWLRRFSSVSIDYRLKELRFNLAARPVGVVALNA